MVKDAIADQDVLAWEVSANNAHLIPGSSVTNAFVTPTTNGMIANSSALKTLCFHPQFAHPAQSGTQLF